MPITMALMRLDGELLRAADGDLARSDDCCCGCPICDTLAYFASTWRFTVADVTESAACDSATPADNCVSLGQPQKDYTFTGVLESDIVKDDNGKCILEKTMAVSGSVCGLTGLQARFLAEWQEVGSVWRLEFEIYGKDSLNQDVTLVLAYYQGSITLPLCHNIGLPLNTFAAVQNCGQGISFAVSGYASA